MPAAEIATSPQGDAHAESLLLHRLRAGDEAAFAEVVRTHAPRLLAVARRFVQETTTPTMCCKKRSWRLSADCTTFTAAPGWGPGCTGLP